MVIMDTFKSSKRESLDCWTGNLGVGPSKDKNYVQRKLWNGKETRHSTKKPKLLR